MITKWYDNKAVLTAPNFVGISVEDMCQSVKDGTEQYLQVPGSEAIRRCNSSMSGLDKLDFILSRH